MKIVSRRVRGLLIARNPRARLGFVSYCSTCHRIIFPRIENSYFIQLRTGNLHGRRKTDDSRSIPSALPESPGKPLNGVRVTVKDIIDLKGVKTTYQSRSYERHYAPREETAPIVSRMVNLGAVVVRKTKCTQFVSSDQPTADWVDYHCPWNPRGDGYLSPRGSSTGTGVALAGYDWVDFDIGSDSECSPSHRGDKTYYEAAGGSIRGPASVMGLPAIRPTHALDRIKNMFPIIPYVQPTTTT